MAAAMTGPSAMGSEKGEAAPEAGGAGAVEGLEEGGSGAWGGVVADDEGHEGAAVSGAEGIENRRDAVRGHRSRVTEKRSGAHSRVRRVNLVISASITLRSSGQGSASS